MFLLLFLNDSSLKLAVPQPNVRWHADSNCGLNLLRRCAPDRSLNTSAVCLFQPLLVCAFLCLVTGNTLLNPKNASLENNHFTCIAKAFLKWAQPWKASSWLFDSKIVDWFFTPIKFFTEKQIMESQGIKTQKKHIKALKKKKKTALLLNFFCSCSLALFGLLLLPSLLSVSVPFFTVVLGSARSKWYPQI